MFTPAVAAGEIDDGTTPTITPEEAIEFRIEHGYLSNFVGKVGYQYDASNKVWNIYSGRKDTYCPFRADTDEKRMKLLNFMREIDGRCDVTITGVAMGALILVSGIVCAVVLGPSIYALILTATGSACTTMGWSINAVSSNLVDAARELK